MSKKINSESYRLGLIQRWPQNFQIYGKSFFLFSSYYLTYLKLEKFVDFLFYNSDNFLISIKNYFFKSLTYFCFHLFETSNIKFCLEKKLINILNFWNFMTKCYPIKLRFYLKNYNCNFFSNLFLEFYIDYLFLKLNYSLKKIINFLLFIVSKKLNQLKFFSSRFGPKKSLLKGFKIQLNGCYDSSFKTTMSKTINFSVGKTTKTSFQDRLEFLNKSLFTKLGTCNFKIWFFYKIL